MKKIINVFIVLMLLVALVACHKQEPDNNDKPETDIYEIFAGKTFYNTYDASECKDYCSITFNADKSFAMNDVFLEGSCMYKGTYTIEDDAINLAVSESGLGEYTEILFTIIENDIINLDTNTVTSNKDNTYICCDKKDLESVIEAKRAYMNDILSGKTFYNVNERHFNIDHSYIEFKSDGSFVMQENCMEGTVEFLGTWQANEYKVNCKVKEVGLGDYNEVVFYIRDLNKLVLETNLFGSIDSDEYTTKEIKGANNILETPYGFYENISQKESGMNSVSNLELRQDGSFTLIEVCGMGVTEVNGLYGREGDVLMFSNFDVEPYDMYGDKLYNFEFRIQSDSTLELIRDLESSYSGNYFVKGENGTSGLVCSDVVYLHETIQDIQTEYLPKIELFKDGTFVVTENVYAGMGQYKGTYESAGTLLLLNITDKSSMQGFMGYDVEQIVLEPCNDGYILHTNLCMSLEGDIFVLQ